MEFTTTVTHLINSSLHAVHSAPDDPHESIHHHEKFITTRENYSNGYIVLTFEEAHAECERSWILIPAEGLWSKGVRGTLYILAMVYLFLGIAIACDYFVGAIEHITSRKKTISIWDKKKQELVEKEVFTWNETVANLTLMALGNAAPEILLEVVDTIQKLDVEEKGDGLGTFTIIGSAAYNLLIISSICITCVPSPNPKKVRELGVYLLCSAWSIFAYIWILVVVAYSSPGEIKIWEAWMTLAWFPLLVITAYCQEQGWWLKRYKNKSTDDPSTVRVLQGNEEPGNIFHEPAKELQTLEKQQRHSKLKHEEKPNESHNNLLNRMVNLHQRGVIWDPTAVIVALVQQGESEDPQNNPSAKVIKAVETQSQRSRPSRYKFRHAAVSSMLGGKKNPPVMSPKKQQKLVELAEKVRTAPIKQFTQEDDQAGKFMFASPSYSVLESSGIVEIDIFFHRRRINKIRNKPMNGGTAAVNNAYQQSPNATAKRNSALTQETELIDSIPEEEFIGGVKKVDYETRDGSGLADKDYKHTQGTLVFAETETKKTITIPIINDNQYTADVEFYVILKNPKDSELGDPSITRVTIIDDDEPGEFQFEHASYNADLKLGIVSPTIVRLKGSDGTVSLEYSTIDGTAIGGEEIMTDVDYKHSYGTMQFKHGETSKTISFEINENASHKAHKNFVITLRNPSLGAKIGDHSAAVCHLSPDPLADRLAELIEEVEDKELTWPEQFKNAMQIGGNKDDDGNEIQPTCSDYILHFIFFLWKIFCATIPPRQYLGAWPAFLVSLLYIGCMTALLDQLSKLLGCIVGLQTAVSGITIVALGTSFPDTFASRAAALQDEHADVSIGHITGSNSVNVFLGLGLPWVISSMYHKFKKNAPLKMEAGNLQVPVYLYSGMAVAVVIIMMIRRKFVGGELGGKIRSKWMSGAFLVTLWFTYVIVTSLKVYDYIGKSVLDK